MTLLVGPDNTALTNNDHSHIRLINDKVFQLGDVSSDELIQAMSEVVDGKTIGTRKTLEILETVGEQETPERIVRLMVVLLVNHNHLKN